MSLGLMLPVKHYSCSLKIWRSQEASGSELSSSYGYDYSPVLYYKVPFIACGEATDSESCIAILTYITMIACTPNCRPQACTHKYSHSCRYYL